jgi:hypothetical protein
MKILKLLFAILLALWVLSPSGFAAESAPAAAEQSAAA